MDIRMGYARWRVSGMRSLSPEVEFGEHWYSAHMVGSWTMEWIVASGELVARQTPFHGDKFILFGVVPDIETVQLVFAGLGLRAQRTFRLELIWEWTSRYRDLTWALGSDDMTMAQIALQAERH